MTNNQKGFAPLLLVILVIVGIAGFLYFSWQKGLIKTKPSQDSSSTPIQDETNWKTYTSNKYSFEFKCPETCLLVYPPDSSEEGLILIDLELKDKNGKIIGQMSIDPSNQDKITLPVEKWFEKAKAKKQEIVNVAFNAKERPNNFIIKNDLQNHIGGETVKVLEYSDKYSSFITMYVLTHNYRIYTFKTITYPEEDAELAQNIFDQILSTFKFID